MPTLPSASKRLASHVLDNPRAVVESSIASIAKQASVGEATVVRLCRQLGYRSLQEFKIDLALEVYGKDQSSEILTDVHMQQDDSPQVLGRKIAQSMNEILQENLDYFDPAAAQRVCKAVYKAGEVFIFGMGNSGLCAAYLANKLRRIGINAVCEQSTHFMYTGASLLKQGDVAVAISQKGSGPETLKAFSIAKESGALCVLLTHQVASELSKLADVVFFTGSRAGFLQSDSLGSMSAQLHICEILYSMIIQLDMGRALKAKQLTLKALDFKV